MSTQFDTQHTHTDDTHAYGQPAAGHNSGPCDTLDPVKGLRRRASAAESPQHATLVWPRPADQAVFRAQAAVASVAESTATVYVAADTRTVLRTTTQTRAAGHPLYSAGRMLDLVQGVISVCDSRLWGRRLLGR
jgi:hypothetical protein